MQHNPLNPLGWSCKRAGFRLTRRSTSLAGRKRLTSLRPKSEDSSTSSTEEGDATRNVACASSDTTLLDTRARERTETNASLTEPDW